MKLNQVKKGLKCHQITLILKKNLYTEGGGPALLQLPPTPAGSLHSLALYPPVTPPPVWEILHPPLASNSTSP